jgi:hypothetical protein
MNRNYAASLTMFMSKKNTHVIELLNTGKTQNYMKYCTIVHC